MFPKITLKRVCLIVLFLEEEPPKPAENEAEKAGTDGEKSEASGEKQDGEKVGEGKTMEVEQVKEVEQYPPSPMMMVTILKLSHEERDLSHVIL